MCNTAENTAFLIAHLHDEIAVKCI